MNRRMTINEIQDNIIEEFSVFDDWMDKYNLLIEMGKELSLIDPKLGKGLPYRGLPVESLAVSPLRWKGSDLHCRQ